MEDAGKVNFQYNSKTEKVCWTVDTADAWRLRKVRISVTPELLDPPNPTVFAFQSPPLLSTSHFSQCIAPSTSVPLPCDGSLLYLYFISEVVHFSEDGVIDKTDTAWAFGTPFTGFRWGITCF
jgi:hypothetical protein